MYIFGCNQIRCSFQNSPEAQVLALIGEGEAHLRMTSEKGGKDLNRIRDLIEEAQKQIDAMPGVSSVHGDFYRSVVFWSGSSFCDLVGVSVRFSR